MHVYLYQSYENKMKILYFFTFCMLLALTAFTQVEYDYYINPVNTDTASQTFPFHKKLNTSGTNVSLRAGAGLSVFGKETVFNQWVAPEVKFSLSPRLHLCLGTMVMHNNFNNFTNTINNETFNINNSKLTQYFLFAQGEYFLNDNLSITGTTFKEISSLTINKQAISYNSLGMNIKLSENFSISTNYTFSKGINYYNLPGNYSSSQSVFPFNNNFSTFNW